MGPIPQMVLKSVNLPLDSSKKNGERSWNPQEWKNCPRNNLNIGRALEAGILKNLKTQKGRGQKGLKWKIPYGQNPTNLPGRIIKKN